MTVDPTTWSGVTGQTTGSTVSLASNGSFALNTMTVKSATTTYTVSSQPVAQSIVAGIQSFTFANFQISASASGEDIRLSSLPIRFTKGAGAANADLTGCQLYDGATALNSGSRTVNTVTSGSSATFTFDNPLVVTKGTIKTLALKCNLSSSVSAGSTVTYRFGLFNTDSFSATGVTSGVSITPSVVTANGAIMTVAAGSLTVTVDPSSPSYALAAGGTTGQTMGVVRLLATNEAVNLTKLGLTLTNTSSSTSQDLTQVYIYDGSTLVGTATFTGTDTSATSTLSSPVVLAKNTAKLLTVKADLADIGTDLGGTDGHLVAIDPVNAEGSGAESGLTIQSGATAGVAGVRVFNTYPTLALDTLPTTGVADGRLMRFKVTANTAGDLGLGEFNFTISSTTGVTVTSVALYGYTNSGYSSPISGQGDSGQIGSTEATITSGTKFDIAPTTNPVTVSAGETRYFELRASVAGVDTGDSIVTTLNGDATYPVETLTWNATANTNTDQYMETVTQVNSAVDNDFIWAPFGTTTDAGMTTHRDWTNGYGVNGLPSSGLIQTRSN